MDMIGKVWILALRMVWYILAVRRGRRGMGCIQEDGVRCMALGVLGV
jgi:hypothetical protein